MDYQSIYDHKICDKKYIVIGTLSSSTYVKSILHVHFLPNELILKN